MLANAGHFASRKQSTRVVSVAEGNTLIRNARPSPFLEPNDKPARINPERDTARTTAGSRSQRGGKMLRSSIVLRPPSGSSPARFRVALSLGARPQSLREAHLRALRQAQRQAKSVERPTRWEVRRTAG